MLSLLSGVAQRAKTDAKACFRPANDHAFAIPAPPWPGCGSGRRPRHGLPSGHGTPAVPGWPCQGGPRDESMAPTLARQACRRPRRSRRPSQGGPPPPAPAEPKAEPGWPAAAGPGGAEGRARVARLGVAVCRRRSIPNPWSPGRPKCLSPSPPFSATSLAAVKPRRRATAGVARPGACPARGLPRQGATAPAVARCGELPWPAALKAAQIPRQRRGKIVINIKVCT